MKSNKIRNLQVKGGDIREREGIKRKEESIISEKSKEDKREKKKTASKDI